MSAKPIARLCDCKGTEKNVYVQEKFTFFVIGYIFFCSFEDKGALEGTIFLSFLQVHTQKNRHSCPKT